MVPNGQGKCANVVSTGFCNDDTDGEAASTSAHGGRHRRFTLTYACCFCLQKSQKRRSSSVSVSCHFTVTFLTRNFTIPAFFFPFPWDQQETWQRAGLGSQQWPPEMWQKFQQLRGKQGKDKVSGQGPRWSDAPSPLSSGTSEALTCTPRPAPGVGASESPR